MTDMTAARDMDHWSSLGETKAAIERGDVTSVDLTRYMLDRIASVDPRVHGYATVTADRALGEATAADRARSEGRTLGVLHGVPIAVKDNCHTAGVATTNGLAVNDGFVPTIDSTVVRKLRDAGAVLLGKLQQTEGAFAGHRADIEIPCNPWGSALWSGESSSGPGVATAAGLCFGAIGTDTGGSIRFPSAACGVVGLKPTWGRVSRFGVFENSASMDHVGPMTRTVEDAALMLTAIAGPDEQDSTAVQRPVPDYRDLASTTDARALRIGVDRAFNSRGQDQATLDMVDSACAVFTGLESTIVPVELPGVDQIVDDWLPTSGVEMAAAHRGVPESDRATYGEPLRSLIRLGLEQPAFDHFLRHQRRLEFRGALERLFTDVDLLLTPVQTGAGITLEHMVLLGREEGSLEKLVRFTAPFDMSGHPALVLPGGVTSEGAPMGFQLVGREFDEATILGAGMAYQSVTRWHLQHPEL